MRQLLPNSDDKDTEMRCLVSKFSVNGGVARSENLLLDTSRLTVTGQGSVNLASEGIDFTLSPRPKDMSLCRWRCRSISAERFPRRRFLPTGWRSPRASPEWRAG